MSRVLVLISVASLSDMKGTDETAKIVNEPHFVGSAGLLNKHLHTFSCSQDVGAIWDFILTESHLNLTAPGT